MIMIDGQYQVFSKPNLLTVPTKRAAWSDRTALLMAEMSKLAYNKFEIDTDGRVMTQDNLNRVSDRLLGGKDGPGESEEAQHDPQEDPILPEGAISLRDNLARAGFQLAGLFSDQRADTQAYLAMSTPKTPQPANRDEETESDSQSGVRPFGDEAVAVLCFRGTGSIRDWLSNIQAVQRNVEGAEVHSGFQAAFDAVRPAIQEQLDPLLAAGRTLYVTGHSLGGALALVATREMGSDSFGACYTFGSPRVGRFEFARFIKTPIYRVVNANDLVPRVPPAYVPMILLLIARALNVPALGLLRGIMQKVNGYVHYGDLRFLRRTRTPDYSDLRVISNPSVIYRSIWFLSGFLADRRSPISNHDINLYCAKLAAYAESRNRRPGDKPNQ